MSLVRRAAFLDRDGVLNRAEVRDGKPYPPRNLVDFAILPDAAEACALLKQHGFLLVVATNQPDVGRGTQSSDVVNTMHFSLLRQLPIDRIEVCYDAGDARSLYRKPAPGMLRRVAADWNLNLRDCFMVGDRWRDIDCGNAAGCTTVFIDRGYQEFLHTQPDSRASNLLEAAHWIIAEVSNPRRLPRVQPANHTPAASHQDLR
ncbi:MAG TPA: HAD-IIIA family hydrolase [Bryobacteraceae bacterium]|jgi:D-glycero-D-manno-heptose 1,7-bisphosphate phosphatase